MTGTEAPHEQGFAGITEGFQDCSSGQIKLSLFLWCLHIYEIVLLNFGFISLKNVILKYYEISRK